MGARAVPDAELVRAPKQARSRQSLDRALDATLSLLAERGPGAFTVIDVARRSGVSTGSIYGRVASKDDLIRAAHGREMDRIDQEAALAFAVPRDDARDLRSAVAVAVRALAGLLQRNADVLAPFMLLGREDPVISARGTAAHERMQAAFVDLLRGRVMAGDGTDSEADLRWACTVAWSVLARQLGLGNDREAAADYPYDEVVARLTETLVADLGAAGSRRDAHRIRR